MMNENQSSREDSIYKFAEDISHKLERILPIRTGYPITKAQYEMIGGLSLEVKAKLGKIPTLLTGSQVAIFVASIMSNFSRLLQRINEGAEGKRLHERAEHSLASSTIILKLLSKILCENEPSMAEGFVSDDEYYAVNMQRYSEVDVCERLDRLCVESMIECLLSMVSLYLFEDALKSVKVTSLLENDISEFSPTGKVFHSIIFQKNLEKQSLGDSWVANNVNNHELSLYKQDSFDPFPYIEEVKYYADFLMRSISKSAPDALYQYIHLKLIRNSDTTEQIPRSKLESYAPLLQYLHFLSVPVDVFFPTIIRILPYIRFIEYKQTFLKFIMISLRDQYFASPQNYLKYLKGGSQMEAYYRNFFDAVSSALDSLPLKDDAVVLSWFSVLCVTDFDDLASKPNKLKIAFNQRLKFLTNLLKETRMGANIECFIALISIFFFGGIVKTVDNGNSVYQFCLSNIDETYENLLKFKHKTKSVAEFDLLIRNFYIAGLMLKENEFLQILESLSKEGSGDFRKLVIVVKTLESLSRSERTRPIFFKVMARLGGFLKSFLYYLTDCSYEKSNVRSSVDSLIERSGTTKRHLYLAQLRGHIEELKSTPREPMKREGNSMASAGKFIAPETISEEEAFDLMYDLLKIFIMAPDLYQEDSEETLKSGDENNMSWSFNSSIIKPIQYTIWRQSTTDSPRLDFFDLSCSLSLTFLDATKITKNISTEKVLQNILASNCILRSICDSCVSLSLGDAKFRYFVSFLSKFTKARHRFIETAIKNKVIKLEQMHKLNDTKCLELFETIILFALCASDMLFYPVIKELMHLYCEEVERYLHDEGEGARNVKKIFDILLDEKIPTGLVSLHKKFRTALKNAKPNSLHQTWLIVYHRWLTMLQDEGSISNQSLLFRHFTEFLVSTLCCFFDETYVGNKTPSRFKLSKYVSDFFDHCNQLLISDDLVIRVIVKDALSLEFNPMVFNMSYKRFEKHTVSALENRLMDRESILYVEQSLSILTSILKVKSPETFLIFHTLARNLHLLIDYVSSIQNDKLLLRLQTKICKLLISILSNKDELCVMSAKLIRNYFAKVTGKWLDQSIFDEGNDLARSAKGEVPNNSSTSHYDSEIAYFRLELAVECSRSLTYQLKELTLETSDSGSIKNVKSKKVFAFAYYISLFCRILEKYTKANSETGTPKFNYKINLIVENVLQCVSNLLEFDTETGIHLVLKLGFHENLKIRAVFLNIFGNLVSSLKLSEPLIEDVDDLLVQITDMYDICAILGQLSSSAEHNLTASSIYSIFHYYRKLDGMLVTLLDQEVNNVSQASVIFRSNSTLTKILNNLSKDYGDRYLSKVIKPFVEDMISENIRFDVDKDYINQESAILFINSLRKLVNLILECVGEMHPVLKFVCSRIYNAVKTKFENASLVAVGSFVFLRFICPVLISPSAYFDLKDDPSIKKSLLQLAKVLQNMANNSLKSLKWPSLQEHMTSLVELNYKVFEFLQRASVEPEEGYSFDKKCDKPVSELRFLYGFIYNHFYAIKKMYVPLELYANAEVLHNRINDLKRLDEILLYLGHNSLYSLQETTQFREDTLESENEQPYQDFMNKIATYQEANLDTQVVRSALFEDGTPVLIISYGYLKFLNDDIQLYVYKVFEMASQIWNGTFYVVRDYTEDYYDPYTEKLILNLAQSLAPSQFFSNCARVYHFNLPLYGLDHIMDTLPILYPNCESFYAYSYLDETDIVDSLKLCENTRLIPRDARVTFDDVKYLYGNSLCEVSLKMGREWLQMVFKEPLYLGSYNIIPESCKPIQVYRFCDIVKCEITNYSGVENEFTIWLYNGFQVTLLSDEREEILKLLYFTLSRLAKQQLSESDTEVGEFDSFGKLYNIAYHGLLSPSEEVNSASGYLFATLSEHYQVDFGISLLHAKCVSFLANTSSVIVNSSKHLAKKFPHMTYNFIVAFLDYYENLPEKDKITGVFYVSPWIDNVCSCIYLDEIRGPNRIAHIVRQFCRITAGNKDLHYVLSNCVWAKLFKETKLVAILCDEIVAFAIDNLKNNAHWNDVISIIYPSLDICSEIISRLINCVNQVTTNDSTIVLQSKLLEIKVLVKIFASLFFNDYILSKFFLANVFFLCTLFIDNPMLNFGNELHKLFINTIQSFLHKTDITEVEAQAVDETLKYFTSQRARMLFGLTRDKTTSQSDPSQAYNKALNIGVLCEYLKQFMYVIGPQDDSFNYIMQWFSDSIDVVLKKNSIFKIRAFLVVSVLSKEGITDFVAFRLLKSVSQKTVSNIQDFSTELFGFSQMVSGLKSTSIFPSKLVWPILYSSFIANTSYQASIQCLINCVVHSKKQGPNYLDKIFGQRHFLEPVATKFEKENGFMVTRDNMDTYIFYLCSQGLIKPHLRQTSLGYLQTYFNNLYDGESKISEAELCHDDVGMPSIVFVYLSNSDESFESFVQSINLEVSLSVGYKALMIPSFILKFLLSKSDRALITTIVAAYYFDQENIDNAFKLKFLCILDYLLHHDKSIAFMVYHIVELQLRLLFETSASDDVLHMISGLQASIVFDESYIPTIHRHDVDSFLERKNLQVIREKKCFVERYSSLNLDVAESTDYHINQVIELIYRVSCSYVDGQILEY